MTRKFLSPTDLLDYDAATIQRLIEARGWHGLSPVDRIGAAYDFVRNDVLFGYNADDALPASRVLADGYGQCNTKSILLMALLRALEVPCRFHGFTIDKRLQRGVVPELVYPLAPRNILHSWVEVYHQGRWLNLEGFILDQRVLEALQKNFQSARRSALMGRVQKTSKTRMSTGAEKAPITKSLVSIRTWVFLTRLTRFTRTIGSSLACAVFSTVLSSAVG